MIKGLLLILTLSLIAAAATHWLHPRAPLWYVEQLEEDEVTVEDVAKRWHNDVLWIDARLREHYDQAHIPGALLLNDQERDKLLFDHMEKLQDNKKPIVVYCDGLACQASRKMRHFMMEQMGLSDVWVLKGGWPAWEKTHPESVKK